MQRQTSSSFLMIAAIAGGAGFVAFVALMTVGGFTVSPAVFLALLVALTAAIVLFRGFHDGAEREKPNLTPSEDGKLGNRLRDPGTAGVKPGSAGMAPGSSASSAALDATMGRSTAPDDTDDTGDAMGSAPSPDSGGMPETADASTDTEENASTPEPDATEDAVFTPDAERGTAAIEGDGEGDSEHSVVEMEPPKLDGPREGRGDDLKQIKGVGPKLESMLQSMGIWHYDQIAAWSEEELAWVDERLEGFKGRASRDEWVAQAKTLSEG